VKQITHPDLKDAYRYRAEKAQSKETSSSLIGYIGLISGIFLLVLGGILATNSGLLRTPYTPPPDTSQQADTTPDQLIKPASELDDRVTGYNALPEYAQQYTNVQPPIAKASGEAINLINNPNAKNVSFDKLRAFILEDDTDEEPYIIGVRMCVDFAETLHNNAEQAGIKTAIVGIKFRDEEIGHALNVFQTKDKGLVYVDCTGEGIKPVTFKEWPKDQTYPVEHDKIAYIEQGEKYGVISIDKARSLWYSFYVEYGQDWQKYADMVEEYNEEVIRYNNEVMGKVYHKGSPELELLEAWKAELLEKEKQIKDLADILGNYLFESLGIVETVTIYW